MRRGVFACAATAVVLFVSLNCEISAAAETTENNERGFYLSASAARAEHEAAGEGQILVGIGPPLGLLITVQPNQVDVDDSDLGWNVTLGYQINKYLAAEVSYYDFGEASVVERYSLNLVLAPLNITTASSIEAFGPGVAVLGTLPITSSIEIFARGGVLFLDQKVERQLSPTARLSTRTGDEIWMAGAGAQWSFTSRWAARLEYQLTDDIEGQRNALSPRASITKIEQLSLGVLFDF